MDGWTDGWMHGWMDGWMDVFWIDVCTFQKLTIYINTISIAEHVLSLIPDHALHVIVYNSRTCKQAGTNEKCNFQ
eukprot:874647-Pelagomonas_calceolata.AAC.2